jgi:hypothetical protein
MRPKYHSENRAPISADAAAGQAECPGCTTVALAFRVGSEDDLDDTWPALTRASPMGSAP